MQSYGIMKPHTPPLMIPLRLRLSGISWMLAHSLTWVLKEGYSRGAITDSLETNYGRGWTVSYAMILLIMFSQMLR